MIILNGNKALFTSDRVSYSKGIKKLAFKIDALFVAGVWHGGFLTAIGHYASMPGYVLILGMDHPLNVYNETSILGIPCTNFIANIGNKVYFLTNYVVPFNNSNATIFQNICCLFACIFKQYDINHNNTTLTIKEMIDPIFEDRLKDISGKFRYFIQQLRYMEPRGIASKYNKENVVLLEESLIAACGQLIFAIKYKTQYIYQKKIINQKFQLVLSRAQKKKVNIKLNPNFISKALLRENICF